MVIIRAFRYLWAFPTTLVGLAAMLAAGLTGGRVRKREGVFEVWGGAVSWILRHTVPLPGGALAMTLGHVILGQSAHELDRCRAHEHVHVRQAERWGPLFLPAYLLASLLLLVRGRDPYRENPFEREAYAQTRIPPAAPARPGPA